jgi:hypothetical protein
MLRLQVLAEPGFLTSVIFNRIYFWSRTSQYCTVSSEFIRSRVINSFAQSCEHDELDIRLRAMSPAMEIAMAIPTLETMAGRLDGLERENRRLRLMAGLTFAGIFIVTAAALFGHTPSRRSIDTEKVVIRDKDGRVRGSFGLASDGLPGLILFDEKGNQQVVLNVPSDGVSSLAFSHKGQERMMLESNYDGWSALRFYDSGEKSNTSLFMSPDSATGLYFANGKQTVTLGVEKNGQSALFTTGPDGEENGRLGSSEVNERTLGLSRSPYSNPDSEPGSLVVAPVIKRLPFPTTPFLSRPMSRGGSCLVLPN